MKKIFIYLALTSCFVLSNTVAYANPDLNQANMHDKMFKDMDTNFDGMVTKDEFNNFGAKKFKEMDVNGDGQVSSKEMKAAHKKMDGSGSVRNKMDDEGKDPTGNERSTSMSGNWDQQHDDAWHKHPDSTWDQKRDDAWHHKSDNTRSGGTHGGRTSGRAGDSLDSGGDSGCSETGSSEGDSGTGSSCGGNSGIGTGGGH